MAYDNALADAPAAAVPAPVRDETFFLGRQPIVGRHRELVAYELLFRSSHVNRATIVDDVAATAAVIQHAFSDLGMAAALGGKQGYINVSKGLLLSDVIEVLPPEHVTLEILETVEITPEVVARCRQLTEAGYTLALDDVVAMPTLAMALLPLMSVVKVDLLAMPQAAIPALVADLRPYGVKVLAEKIDTPEQYDFCHKLGFDLFQGYFFAKPSVLAGRRVAPQATTLIRIFSLTAADADLDVLENALKQAPDLILRLLKMANDRVSPYSGKISSIRNAIIVLGRAQINRFVQIMLFAQHSGTQPGTDPLVQTAVIRGSLMEGLAIARGWSTLKDRAFMVGMLSLVDALFGQPLEEIVLRLNLEDDLQRALLRREGPLGLLLQLAEASETADSQRAMALVKQLDLADAGQFKRLQIEAFEAASKL
jgi:EAL and modified HD-GYP domain-containing signal transduction protein